MNKFKINSFAQTIDTIPIFFSSEECYKKILVLTDVVGN